MNFQTIIRAIRGLVFLVVPAYKSFCLVRLVTHEQRGEEMPTDLAARIQDISTFWIVLSVSVAIEYVADQVFLWVPYYELFKSAYFYWLAQHDYSCALLLYRAFICPLLQSLYAKVQKKIVSPFEALEWMKAEVARKITTYAPTTAAT